MKINYVYSTLNILSSGYMGSEGLRYAFQRNGLLNYAYDCNWDLLDKSRLYEAPTYFMRGFMPDNRIKIVKMLPGFKASWRSESYYTNKGELDKSTKYAVDNQSLFDMYFVTADTDLDKYDIPCYFLPSWADTSIFQECDTVEHSGLGFIGGTEDREEFLNGDTKGIINRKRTELHSSPIERAKAYAKLISKFRMLVSPEGRCFNGLCGRAFEIMACKRLCFQYYNPDTMFKTAPFFEDGVDIVYFRDWDELNDKYEYYRKNWESAEWVAYRGWKKVRQFHNENIRSRYIVDCMEREANAKLQ